MHMTPSFDINFLFHINQLKKTFFKFSNNIGKLFDNSFDKFHHEPLIMIFDYIE